MDYKPLPIPSLTHLQVLICWALQSPYWEGLTVRDLLAVLKRHNEDMSESAFYQLMQRLETAGFIVSEAAPPSPKRRRTRLLSRWYRLTRDGREELNRTMEFYQAHREHPKRFFCADFNVSLLTEDDWNGDRAIKSVSDTAEVKS
jgi:DNA-binding PadR family transcriptional regulator